MNGSWYEQDGLPHERNSENVRSTTWCNQRKLIYWQTKNESSDNEDSHSGSEEENLPVFEWIINIKFLNENLKEVAICKHCENCENVLLLTKKANQVRVLLQSLHLNAQMKNVSCITAKDFYLYKI